MKKKQQKAQIILILTGLLLIFIFYYPYMNKIMFVEDKVAQKNSKKTPIDEQQDTLLEQLEYQGQYENQPFTIKSEKAYIRDESDAVFMTNVHMILYLNDGRIVNITSNEGKYFRLSHDTFFVGDVFATDSETQIFSQNLDLTATKNTVEIYNDVNLNYPTGSIKADKIDYDFKTKNFKISMFGDETVKMKIVK